MLVREVIRDLGGRHGGAVGLQKGQRRVGDEEVKIVEVDYKLQDFGSEP